MKDKSFPLSNIFNNNYTAIGDAKTKKKKTTTTTTKKIKNLFVVSSARTKNRSAWLAVPDSPASTMATIELSRDEETNPRRSTHWELLEDWSVSAALSASERKDRKRDDASISVDFIDGDDLSDWMELGVDGTVSPRSGNSSSSSHHRRNDYATDDGCCCYNNNDDDESVLSSVSAITIDSGTTERAKNTIESDDLDAIYAEIALGDDYFVSSARTIRHDEDSINGSEIVRCLGLLPLLDHDKTTSSCHRSIDDDSTSHHREKKKADGVVRIVRTAVRRSVRGMLASSGQNTSQWKPLSSSSHLTCSDCTW